jgi:hypothetical protein
MNAKRALNFFVELMEVAALKQPKYFSWASQTALKAEDLNSFPMMPLEMKDLFSLVGSHKNGILHCPVDSVMAAIYPSLWQSNTFSSHLWASINWLNSCRGEINVGDEHQKPLAFVVLTEIEGEYTLSLTTQENAAELATIFEGDYSKNSTKKLWLLRPSGAARAALLA